MIHVTRFMVSNSSDRQLQLGLEPEGHCITIAPGQKCEIGIVDSTEGGELEIEYEDTLISVYFSGIKEAWLNGTKVR